jgi:hypothetical protein
MKVFGISKDGMFYRIGEKEDTKDWYKKSAAVENFIRNIQRGDEVEIKFILDDTNTKVLEFISKKRNTEFSELGSEKVIASTKPILKTEYPSHNSYDYQKPKTPEESDQIRKLSIIASVANSLKGIGGVDINNVESIINNLFNIYSKLSK